MTPESASGAPALTFSSISMVFHEKVLFEDLSFSVEAGKCTCLLGPSGCGKSTLLRLASGNRSIPFSGEIMFSSTHHRTGWMGQDDLLLPWMNVLDNVMLGAKLRGEITGEVRQRARSLLQAAGLERYEKALPETLSGGMRQRTALLRTLMEECEVVLMDEPFSALDALTRIKLQDLAATMTRDKTVLLVTHDPMEAIRMAHEILVLAGEPSTITSFADLPGTPPRPAGSPHLASLYQRILESLLVESP